ncbi:MAG: hypothetical protein QNJ58_21460 [Desulfobacterales bacterium]|nr:hypothetical protein [Desulfobacterales bacterium]
MQIISNIALLSINETLIVQLLSFLIFLFIINRVMFRPLRSTIDEREDYLKKINNEIEDAKDELETIARRIEAHESAVKLEAFGLKDKLEESGNQEAAEIIASAREEITGLKQNAASQIDLQISDARDHLKRESEALSMNIMEKILDRRPTQ